MTPELLARKGEAVSAVREVLQGPKYAGHPPFDGNAAISRDGPGPSGVQGSAAVLSKGWIAGAAVLLVAGSVAIGYFARPKIEPYTVRKAEPVAAVKRQGPATNFAAPSADNKQEAVTPVAVAPAAADETDTDLAVAIAPERKTAVAVPSPPAEMSGTNTVADAVNKTDAIRDDGGKSALGAASLVGRAAAPVETPEVPIEAVLAEPSQAPAKVQAGVPAAKKIENAVVQPIDQKTVLAAKTRPPIPAPPEPAASKVSAPPKPKNATRRQRVRLFRSPWSGQQASRNRHTSSNSHR